jgi:diacylglycerol kinase (ATP)
MNLKRKWPPISVLPLGTGNDLARVHGWGGGYNNESLIGILQQIAESYISLLDRWEMTIEDSKGKVKEVKSFFNYLGVAPMPRLL